MQKSIVLREISPETKTVSYSGDNIKAGIPIPKSKRIQLFSPSEWEDFTEEVASSLESIYHKVKRFSGPGDMGLDVVGFVNTDNFADGWDNYQCKHYNSPLTPSDIWVEIGKIIYHSFNEEFPPPKKYYFIGSKDIGRTLSHLLSSPNKLKIECIKNWDRHCAKKISSRFTVNLSGDILNYFNDFDFEIFS